MIHYSLFPLIHYSYIQLNHYLTKVYCLISLEKAFLYYNYSTKPEMGWYVRNVSELQSPSRVISFTGPTRRLITHQAISWTQQLYKDKHTQVVAQKYHHPNPYTPLRQNTVTDPMKICPICSPGFPTSNLFLYGDSIHLHIHCTNVHIQHTRTRSNEDISIAIKHLGALFPHVPYMLNRNGYVRV